MLTNQQVKQVDGNNKKWVGWEKGNGKYKRKKEKKKKKEKSSKERSIRM
jgi:hypothetical protein